MAKKPTTSDSVTDDGSPKTPEADEARYWLAELNWSHKEQKDWEERGTKIVQRYMDERGEYMERDIAKPQRRLNLLWANVETLLPAYFNRQPVPNVTLANKDKNPVGRWAAITLERCIEAELRDDEFMASMEQAIKDLLLAGRGVVWMEYDADVDGDDDDSADTDDDAKTAGAPPKKPATITRQDIIVRYVHWKDFRTNRARNWPEVTWGGKRAFLDREQLVAKYGDKIGNAITLDHKPQELRRDPVTQQQFSKATIWQVWDSKTRKIIEVAPGYKQAPLRKFDPVTKFSKFFPFPRPLYATLAGESLMSTADYVQYQDQAEEVDQLTNRIYGLSKAIRLRGFYDQSFNGLQQLFNDANDNELIPVEGWMLLAEKGGFDKVLGWVPLKDIIVALQGAYEAREQAKQSLYEITGLSDIRRGATDPDETAKAQEKKSQYGDLRTRKRQQDIQRLARDIIRMMAEIICQHYTLQTIQTMSGVKLLTMQQKQAVQAWQQMMQQAQQRQQAIQQQMEQAQQTGAPPMPPPQLPPPPPPPPIPGFDPGSDDYVETITDLTKEPTWEQVYALLRDSEQRRFVIDVETDSTVEPDQIAERDAATQFLTAVTQFIGAWGEILGIAPEMAPLAGELLTFAARKWKIGDTLETKIEEAAQLIAKKANMPKPPDPKMYAEMLKAQAEGAKTQGAIKTANIKANAEQTKAQLDVVSSALEHQQATEKIMHERAASNQEHQQRMTEMAQQAAMPQPQANGGE